MEARRAVVARVRSLESVVGYVVQLAQEVRVRPEFMPGPDTHLQDRCWALPLKAYPLYIGFIEEWPIPVCTELGFGRVSPLPHHELGDSVVKSSPTIKIPDNDNRPLKHESFLANLSPVDPTEPKISGTKRKAAPLTNAGARKFLRPTPKEWGCALCRVSATSEEGLNDHLQSKKHKAKAAQLLGNKVAANTKSNSAPEQKKAVNITKGNAAIGLKAGRTRVLSKKHQGSMRRDSGLWCKLCKLTCNSTSMMADHLQGKKHRAQRKRAARQKKLRCFRWSRTTIQ